MLVRPTLPPQFTDRVAAATVLADSKRTNGTHTLTINFRRDTEASFELRFGGSHIRPVVHNSTAVSSTVQLQVKLSFRHVALLGESRPPKKSRCAAQGE